MNVRDQSGVSIIRTGMRAAASTMSLVGVVALMGCAHPAEPPMTRSTAGVVQSEDVMDRVVKRYASLRTYEDHGATFTFSLRDNQASFATVSTSFQTMFERDPARLRLAFWDVSRQPSVLFANGSDVKSRGVGGTERDSDRSWASLDAALVGLSGVSNGISRIVPALLAGDNPWECRHGAPPKSRIAGDELVGPTKTTRVEITRTPCEPATIWVDEDFLVRKLVHRFRIDPDEEKKNLEILLDSKSLLDAHPDLKNEIEKRAAEATSASTHEVTVVFAPRVDAPVDRNHFRLDTN